MALRTFAILFGIIFLFIGVIGFMPFFIIDGNVLGVFQLESMHSTVYIVSGLIALLASIQAAYAKLYFQIIGMIYAILAGIGFWQSGDLMVMQVNYADNVIHAAIAIFALFLGFMLSAPQPHR